MKATVISDASFYRRPRKPSVAGWAAWVRVDNLATPIKGYGTIKKGLCETSTEAEMYAALNGIWLAVQHGGTDILVRSDCMTVTHAILGELQSERLLKIWWGALRDHGMLGVNLHARHVKGHGRIIDRATWVNNWVDEKAGYAQREARRGKKICKIIA